MSLDALPGLIGVALVTLATLAIGTWGLRFSRTTSDFFVASRSVNPRLNASAIGGEYLSAASFLGIAGLVMVQGADMLWYPIGWTAGYLILLALVAAPLRRSGAYTLPDFAEARLGSAPVRKLCSVLVVAIGWLYLMPQFRGAGIALHAVLGAPEWVGPLIVGAIVLIGVSSGGMRSITFVQAFQYWLKLTALLVPAAVLLVVWLGDGAPPPVVEPSWSVPLADGGVPGLYLTYSLIIATCLGTMGLPHVVVRFYTNPDGGGARRTTLVVLVLLGIFYLLPPVYGALGRVYGSEIDGTTNDSLVLNLPAMMVDSWIGAVLTGLVVAGAFAAFLSTSSGLSIAVAGVLSQDLVTPSFRRQRVSGVTAFRLAAVVAVAVPCLGAMGFTDIGVARVVGLAFAVSASTFCPLLLLGIWWRRLTDIGAAAGLLVGFLGSGSAVVWALREPPGESWLDLLLAQPAAWTVPLAFVTMITVSLLTQGRVVPRGQALLGRLHTPEELRDR